MTGRPGRRGSVGAPGSAAGRPVAMPLVAAVGAARADALAADLVVDRPLVVPLERVRIPIAPGDVVVVEPGARVEAGAPVVERLRDPEVVEAAPPEGRGLRSGARLPSLPNGRPAARRRFAIGARRSGGSADPGERSGDEATSTPTGDGPPSEPQAPDRTAPAGASAGRGSAGELVFRWGGGWLVVRGEHTDPGIAPIGGTVVAVQPGRAVEITTAGWRIPGTDVLGDPSFGPLAVAPDGEGRAAGLDVDFAGAIVVVEGRIDAETIGRAKAMGLRGIVVGALAGRVRRAVEASEARQRAALHPRRPFAVLVLGGEQRRPIPGPLRDLLVGLAGRPVGIVGDPPGLVVEGPVPRVVVPPDRVVVRAGRWAGTEGRLAGLVGVWRFAAGVHLVAARVVTDAGEELIVPVPDLVRYRGTT